MKKKTCFIIIVLFILITVLSNFCVATTADLDDDDTTYSRSENQEDIDVDDYQPAHVTSDEYDIMSELSLTNMINIVLIAVGVVLILLAIAILIKIK